MHTGDYYWLAHWDGERDWYELVEILQPAHKLDPEAYYCTYGGKHGHAPVKNDNGTWNFLPMWELMQLGYTPILEGKEITGVRAILPEEAGDFAICGCGFWFRLDHGALPEHHYKSVPFNDGVGQAYKQCIYTKPLAYMSKQRHRLEFGTTWPESGNAVLTREHIDEMRRRMGESMGIQEIRSYSPDEPPDTVEIRPMTTTARSLEEARQRFFHGLGRALSDNSVRLSRDEQMTSHINALERNSLATLGVINPNPVRLMPERHDWYNLWPVHDWTGIKLHHEGEWWFVTGQVPWQQDLWVITNERGESRHIMASSLFNLISGDLEWNAIRRPANSALWEARPPFYISWHRDTGWETALASDFNGVTERLLDWKDAIRTATRQYAEAATPILPEQTFAKVLLRNRGDFINISYDLRGTAIWEYHIGSAATIPAPGRGRVADLF